MRFPLTETVLTDRGRGLLVFQTGMSGYVRGFVLTAAVVLFVLSSRFEAGSSLQFRLAVIFFVLLGLTLLGKRTTVELDADARRMTVRQRFFLFSRERHRELTGREILHIREGYGCSGLDMEFPDGTLRRLAVGHPERLLLWRRAVNDLLDTLNLEAEDS